MLKLSFSQSNSARVFPSSQPFGPSKNPTKTRRKHGSCVTCNSSGRSKTKASTLEGWGGFFGWVGVLSKRDFGFVVVVVVLFFIFYFFFFLGGGVRDIGFVGCFFSGGGKEI